MGGAAGRAGGARRENRDADGQFRAGVAGAAARGRARGRLRWWAKERQDPWAAAPTRAGGWAGGAGGVARRLLTVGWSAGARRPPRPRELPEGNRVGDNGILLVGDRGFILDNRV